MKKFINKIAGALVLTGALFVTPKSHAFTLDWSAADTNELTLANGTTGLPVGNVVEIGYFNLTDSQIQTDQNNPLLLQQNFNAFAVGHIGDGTADGTHPSGYAAVFSEETTAAGTGFFSKAIYLLVLNVSATNQASSATQVGVFKGDSSWVFPAADNSPISSIDMDSALPSPLVGSYFSNSYNSDALGGIANAFALHAVVAVPEPSSMALVGMGLIGVVMVRRRKKA